MQRLSVDFTSKVEEVRRIDMKLFTYLLIDDSVVKNLLVPLFPEEEPDYLEQYMKKPRNNRFYSCAEMPEILFMSYKYTNVALDVISKEDTTKWGYVIIDNISESDKKNRIDLVGTIRKYKNWGIDKDKKQLENRYLSTSDFLTVDTSMGMKCFKAPEYRRYGGHLGHGKTGVRAETLHELILKTKKASFNSITTRLKPITKTRTLNGVTKTITYNKKVFYDYMGNSIKNPRIHHKGHAFDNRAAYLMPLSREEHAEIHKLETNMQFACRPEYIGYYEDKYSQNLYCTPEDKKEGCICCSAILHIKTKQQFCNFIESLKSDKYRSLENKRIYDQLKKEKLT